MADAPVRAGLNGLAGLDGGVVAGGPRGGAREGAGGAVPPALAETAQDPGRAAGPDPERYAADRAAEEAAAFRHAHVPPDAVAAYGPHPDQVVDFYRPRGGTGLPAPLVGLLHGGAWRARYDRRHVSPLAAHLAAHGFAVASVEYRRGAAQAVGDGARAGSGAASGTGLGADAGTGTAGRWPETFDDVAAALDVLPELAVKALGGDAVDPRRVVLTGHSAGGQLVLWAAARHLLPAGSRWRRQEPLPLRGVVALAPIADLGVALREAVCGGAVAQLLGGGEQAAGRGAQADPALLVPTGVATTLVHGTLDEVVPARQSALYAAAAAACGEAPTVAWLPGTGHFPLIDPSAAAAATVVAELAQLAF